MLETLTKGFSAAREKLAGVRELTAEYIVFSAANTAPMAMMTPTTMPKPLISAARSSDWAA